MSGQRTRRSQDKNKKKLEDPRAVCKFGNPTLEVEGSKSVTILPRPSYSASLEKREERFMKCFALMIYLLQYRAFATFNIIRMYRKAHR